ncbi:MAG: hypothetical protein ACTSRK_04395 [Promethearchaeota archaeon]
MEQKWYLQLLGLMEDGLLEGDYNITIIVMDESGNSTQDTVIFTVSDVEAPQFTAIPEDFSANEGYSDLSVSWTASDLHPATYSIELDGTEVVSATTWTDGMVISYPVPDGLLEGDYKMMLRYSNLPLFRKILMRMKGIRSYQFPGPFQIYIPQRIPLNWMELKWYRPPHGLMEWSFHTIFRMTCQLEIIISQLL